MDARLIQVLVCPMCKGALHHKREQQELICKPDRLAFGIRDGIPNMLIEAARAVSETEAQSLA